MTQRTVYLILCALTFVGLAMFGPYSCGESQPQQAFRLDLRNANRARPFQIVRKKSPEDEQALVTRTIEVEMEARAHREEDPKTSASFDRSGSRPVGPVSYGNRSKKEAVRKVGSGPSLKDLKAVAKTMEGDSADLGNAMKDLNDISQNAVGLMRLLLNPRFLQNSDRTVVKNPRE